VSPVGMDGDERSSVLSRLDGDKTRALMLTRKRLQRRSNSLSRMQTCFAIGQQYCLFGPVSNSVRSTSYTVSLIALDALTRFRASSFRA